jgi:hypothetical protein
MRPSASVAWPKRETRTNKLSILAAKLHEETALCVAGSRRFTWYVSTAGIARCKGTGACCRVGQRYGNDQKYPPNHPCLPSNKMLISEAHGSFRVAHDNASIV